jgi:chemosensory pili system protein ChpC
MADTPTELYSLLIPLHEERLLVPRVCVAEVVGFTEPQAAPEHSPNWFLGMVNWSGRQLPLVSFEGAMGKAVPESRVRTRIVVFHAMGRDGYFGILTQGFPQLVRVNPDVLSPDSAQHWGDDDPVICRIRMINEYPLIPDIESLTRMIDEARQAA